MSAVAVAMWCVVVGLLLLRVAVVVWLFFPEVKFRWLLGEGARRLSEFMTLDSGGDCALAARL